MYLWKQNMNSKHEVYIDKCFYSEYKIAGYIQSHLKKQEKGTNGNKCK